MLQQPFKETHIYQVEKIQQNIARFVINDHSHYSSVLNMLNHLLWPTLEDKWTYLKYCKIEKTNQHYTINLTPLDSITVRSP